MPATPFDSAHLHKLFPTHEVARLFSDAAELRAMMLVEGTLAKVQGTAGVIPEISAAAIHRASLEVQIDPGALAHATGENGVSVPAFVRAFRNQMQAPEHAQYLHWGATSQDIIDTGLMLRLKRALALLDDDLSAALSSLADLAERHAETPLPARTYGQHATVTSFGAVVAGWGWPLLQAREGLATVATNGLLVSLAGAAGTAAELGPDPAALRAALAEALGLIDPGRSWHSDRTPVLRLVTALTTACQAAGKMAADLLLHTQTDVSEVKLSKTGASSTMPQKQNPVGPSAIQALAMHAAGLQSTLQHTARAQAQRDGAAWFAEWLALPQLVMTTAAALRHVRLLAKGVDADTARMATNLSDGLYAEALSFALTDRMPRPDAQAAVKAFVTSDEGLRAAALSEHPDLAHIFAPEASLGTAPADALSFVRKVRETAKSGR